MKNRILFVDDEPDVLSGLRKMLSRQRKRWEMVFAVSGAEGLQHAKEGAFDVVVSDMRMPGMDGIEFLSQLKAFAPQTVRLMLTGNTDLDTAISAVNEGNVFRFLNKPCKPEKLLAMLEVGIEQYRLITAEKELLTQTLSGSVKLMTEVLSANNPEVFQHSIWLRDLVRVLARHFKLSNSWEVQLAAMLSRIGFMALPPETATKIYKNEVLSEDEKKKWDRLPEIGYNLLYKIPRLEGVARIIRYQDKNYNGTGFPKDSVKEEEIPLGARLLKILTDADRWSAKRYAGEELLKIMRSSAGFYDPKLLEKVIPLFVPSTLSAAAKEGKSEEIPLSQLRLGHKLLGPVETLDGMIIVGAGTYISSVFLEKIKMYAELDEQIKEPIMVEKENN